MPLLKFKLSHLWYGHKFDGRPTFVFNINSLVIPIPVIISMMNIILVEIQLLVESTYQIILFLKLLVFQVAYASLEYFVE